MGKFVEKEALPPPVKTTGAVAWVRQNLISTPLNILLTAISLYVIFGLIWPLINWAFIDASFAGEDPSACTGAGACWVFIKTRLGFFTYGFYEESERWRVDLSFVLLALVVVPQFIKNFPFKTWIGVAGLTILPIIVGILLVGGSFGLPPVATHQWGGLMLTLVLSYVGIVAALPFGVILALGRRSQMPTVKVVCVAFIELWRGVPLISVLFMASVMLPLFLPQGWDFEKLSRALIGIIMFQSAYMAEVIRGGLQAIPKGQFEAASALGLGYWRSMGLIVMPQALKHVIPGIVNTFIALFKDTTLVLIIGLLDILASVQSAIVDPKWGGVATEGYVFAALCFWVFCYGMSKYSQSLERKLHTGHKR